MQPSDPNQPVSPEGVPEQPAAPPAEPPVTPQPMPPAADPVSEPTAPPTTTEVPPPNTETPPAQPEPPAVQPAPPPEQPEHGIKNPLAAMRPGEKVVCVIKPHPIGIAGLYIGFAVVLLFIAVAGYGIAPSMLTDASKSQVYGYSTLALLVAAVIGGLFVTVGHVVYWGNSWIVTSDSITQVTQTALFAKKSSQLSMANLEDITAEQNGILPHMFNYGLIWAETAGERDKFRFPYCPDPNGMARQILAARETFEQESRAQVPGAAAAPAATQPYQAPPAA